MSSEKFDALAPTRARHKVSNKSKNTKWSSEEDALLIKLMKEKPSSNWSEYVHYFAGKTGQQVAERWEKVLNPTLIKGSWTREEDETIIEFVQQHGTKNWTKLSTLLPGRIGKQCRERWRNHLDPDVNRNAWTEEEDNILIEMHDKIGNQWVKIAEYLPGRSDNAIKNRWNSTLKKRLECIRTGTPRKRRGRPSSHSQTAAPKSADDVPRPPKFEDIAPNVKTISPIKATAPELGSPFNYTGSLMQSPLYLKSPFQMTMSPMKDSAYTPWSLSNNNYDLETVGSFSPALFSPMGQMTPSIGGMTPSIGGMTPLLTNDNDENTPDGSINLLSPLIKK